jgi:hypothetical protein
VLCWKSQPPQPPGGRDDLDGVSAAERTAGVLGDLDGDRLTRQRVPDEDHPAIVTCDAVAAVGYRRDLDRESPPHPARSLGLGCRLGHVCQP